jgi:hypothetical protein
MKKDTEFFPGSARDNIDREKAVTQRNIMGSGSQANHDKMRASQKPSVNHPDRDGYAKPPRRSDNRGW